MALRPRRSGEAKKIFAEARLGRMDVDPGWLTKFGTVVMD
jgi:hypothetical protein